MPTWFGKLKVLGSALFFNFDGRQMRRLVVREKDCFLRVVSDQMRKRRRGMHDNGAKHVMHVMLLNAENKVVVWSRQIPGTILTSGHLSLADVVSVAILTDSILLFVRAAIAAEQVTSRFRERVV